MSTSPKILTDAMIEEIKAFFPRYPSRQAVTLPALHIVNEHLRHVPLQAVVEVAQLLDLAPSQVQDTLSFYGYFKQDAPAGHRYSHGFARRSGPLAQAARLPAIGGHCQRGDR